MVEQPTQTSFKFSIFHNRTNRLQVKESEEETERAREKNPSENIIDFIIRCDAMALFNSVWAH